ncbi:hypothetical protein O181_026850 [Austropuccinia psidii MF-1]|uniref:Uncharacterized protein n=1 Tax=Austropuccinia psidii MF-1 TaxID=1389203 RepID=A0A9Q3H2K9_9BASI|nr:hypothetical protein [Austropuccinia psidii MF-1]
MSWGPLRGFKLSKIFKIEFRQKFIDRIKSSRSIHPSSTHHLLIIYSSSTIPLRSISDPSVIHSSLSYQSPSSIHHYRIDPINFFAFDLGRRSLFPYHRSAGNLRLLVQKSFKRKTRPSRREGEGEDCRLQYLIRINKSLLVFIDYRSVLEAISSFLVKDPEKKSQFSHWFIIKIINPSP